MASATNYLENKIRDHVLGLASFTMPTHIYLALFTASPGETGGGTECTGGSYARIEFPAWTAGGTGSGAATNTDDEAFTNMPACTVVAAALMDASTSGNMLIYKVLDTPRVIPAGSTLPVDVGGLSLTVA